MGQIVSEVTYTYRAEVIPPGKRRVVRRMINATMPVLLKALDSDDFPVACRLNFGDTDSQLEVIRWDGERMYANCSSGNTEDEAIVSVHDCLAGVKNNPLSGGAQPGSVTAGEIQGKIVSDNGDLLRAGITADSGDLLICDGQAWRACDEFVWIVNLGVPGQPSIVLDALTRGMIRDAGFNPVFRQDGLHEAIAAAACVDNAPPVIRGRSDVLLPDVLSLPVEAIGVLSVIAEIIRQGRNLTSSGRWDNSEARSAWELMCEHWPDEHDPSVLNSPLKPLSISETARRAYIPSALAEASVAYLSAMTGSVPDENMLALAAAMERWRKTPFGHDHEPAGTPSP